MNFLVRMAFRNVVRHWRHSLATLMAIALGLVSVSLFHGYLADVIGQFSEFFIRRAMFGHVLVEKEATAQNASIDPWKSALDDEDLRTLDELVASPEFGVAHRVRFLNISGIVATSNMSTSFFGYAYDAADGALVRGKRWLWNTPFGKPLQTDDTQTVLVGRGLSELLGCSFGEPRVQSDGSYATEDVALPCFDEELQLSGVTERAQMNAVNVRIQGIVDAGYKDLDDSWLLMPLPLGRTLFNTKRTSLVGLMLHDASLANKTSEALRRAALVKGKQWRVTPWQDHSVAEVYRSNMIILTLFRNFVFIIVCAVGALSMSNTILRSVTERTREIGSLRALGFKPRSIRLLFSLEGAFLGLMGSLVGVVVRNILALAINTSGFTYVPGLISQPVPLRIAFTPIADVVLSLILVVTSAIIAWVASRRASSHNIVEALTHS